MLADELPFRELVDAAPDGLIVCDPAGSIVLVNAEAERMFGYSRDELIGQQIELLVPASVRAQHPHYIAGFTRAPRLRPMGSGLELHGARKGGAEFPVEISLSPIQTPRGMLITAGIRDITERRALETEKRRATAYLTSAVDAVQDAFALFDERDEVVMVNSAARQLFGRELGRAVVGMTFDAVVRSSLEQGVFDLGTESRDAFLARWLAYHRDPVGSLEIRGGGGRHLRVTERRTPEHGTVAMIADITADVHREAELRSARAAAEAASAAKSEFLSSMSHELRTPLNAVLGFAQLLERDKKNPLDARQVERVQHVLRGGEHLLRLIEDVLDLAKIEAGRVSMSIETVAIGDVLHDVCNTLAAMAARAAITLVRPAAATGLPDILADRTRLSQILMNFGSNAVKYGRPGGTVAFELVASAERLRIAIRDDGIGIPDAQRARVFEPFHRAGQENGPVEGTGIGLAISKRLALLMHGAVGFTSEPGTGSCFWVDLPIRRDAPAPAPAPAVAPPERTQLGEAAATPFRIVYVEDNPSNIAFMRSLMDDYPRVQLQTAHTAELGLELIRACHPDAVIMDINLPGMSGFDAMAQLRAWPDTRDLPVIGLSAAALAQHTQQAGEVGFYRYLTKPVQVAELTAVLETLLERMPA